MDKLAEVLKNKYLETRAMIEMKFGEISDCEEKKRILDMAIDKARREIESLESLEKEIELGAEKLGFLISDEKPAKVWS